MVSIVLPTYNRENSVCSSIESVLRQTYQNFELIIVDDGSSDNSKELISKYAEKDNRIKYFYQDNAGYPSAINRGLIECTGEYIAFEDSDDIWDDTKLEKQLSAINNTNADFSFCQMEYPKLSLIFPNSETKDKNGNIFERLLAANMIGGPTLIFKKACMDAIGGFDISLPTFQDYDFVLRLSKKYKAVFVPEVLLYCGVGSDNMQNDNMNFFKARLLMLAKYKDDYKKYPESANVYLNYLYENAASMGIEAKIKELAKQILQ